MGLPLANLPKHLVMTAEDCVDAALRGLDMGEKITLPSVHDPELLFAYERTVKALFDATQLTGKPAPRYALKAEYAA